MSSDVSDPTSLSLLQRARSNDEQAWQQLVHLYGPLVHRWCKRAGLKDEDVSDVFQESFRAVSSNLSNFAPNRPVGAFRSWLRTIVRTKIVDHFRRLAKNPPGTGGTEAQLRMDDVADPLPAEEDDDDVNENALVVQRAMEMIKPHFSQQNWNAFWQVAVEGHSAVEVAETLQMNPQAVRQANYRIRRRLRLVLEGLVE